VCIDLVRGEGCRSRIAKTCHVVPPILLINLGWSSHPNRVSKFFLLLFEYFDTHTPQGCFILQRSTDCEHSNVFDCWRSLNRQIRSHFLMNIGGKYPRRHIGVEKPGYTPLPTVRWYSIPCLNTPPLPCIFPYTPLPPPSHKSAVCRPYPLPRSPRLSE
jgi:hypothetical protein